MPVYLMPKCNLWVIIYQGTDKNIKNARIKSTTMETLKITQHQSVNLINFPIERSDFIGETIFLYSRGRNAKDFRRTAFELGKL